MSGAVSQAAYRGLAQDTAANLPGVKSVDNRLKIKAQAPLEKTNEWLAMKVKKDFIASKIKQTEDSPIAEVDKETFFVSRPTY